MPSYPDLIVIGRAESTGLGSMTQDFCREMNPGRIFVVRRQPEHKRHIDPNYVPGCVIVEPHQLANPALYAGAKAVVNFEIYYHREAQAAAETAGAQNIIYPMWECSPVDLTGDVMIAVSNIDKECYPQAIRLDWPISRQQFLTTARITPPKVFAHNVGRGGMHWRNGTEQVLQASKYLIGTDAVLKVRSLIDVPGEWVPAGAPVEFYGPVENRAELFKDIDVLVFPMRFPGLSLPMSEAAAAGIPIIVLDLPEWQTWPHRVPAINPVVHRKSLSRPVTYWEADVDALGTMMRGMALGEIQATESPKPPTWEEYAKLWADNIWTRL